MRKKKLKVAKLAFPLLLLSRVLIGQREIPFCLQINAMYFSDKCHRTVNYRSQKGHGHERKVKTSRELERPVATLLFPLFSYAGECKELRGREPGIKQGKQADYNNKVKSQGVHCHREPRTT